MSTQLVLIHALSPLHPGTGQAVGAIDLPIARERPTGIPLVPGSSIKGALRARSFEREADAKERGETVAGPSSVVIFGPETKDSSDHAGAAQFSDAHVVLLPVRSLAGTFAWTTSPYLLARFARDAREAKFDLLPAPTIASPESCLVLGSCLTVNGRVVLEDLDFAAETANGDSALTAYAGLLGELLFPDDQNPGDLEERERLKERICLVHDDTMSFLLETSTEISARVRLDEKTKTVAKGALWTEEALPTETLLSGLAIAGRVRRNGDSWSADQILESTAALTAEMIQLGGKANVGRGSCRVRFAGGAQ